LTPPQKQQIFAAGISVGTYAWGAFHQKLSDIRFRWFYCNPRVSTQSIAKNCIETQWI